MEIDAGHKRRTQEKCQVVFREVSRVFVHPVFYFNLGLNKSSDAKLTNLSRPLFSQSNRDFTSNFVASDSKLSGEEMLTEMEPSRQLVAESGPSRSYSMRFRMDFVYPTVKRDANDEIVPNSVISSQDFNDNFDIINLTQMLEKTTAEAFANEGMLTFNSPHTCRTY